MLSRPVQRLRRLVLPVRSQTMTGARLLHFGKREFFNHKFHRCTRIFELNAERNFRALGSSCGLGPSLDAFYLRNLCNLWLKLFRPGLRKGSVRGRSGVPDPQNGSGVSPAERAFGPTGEEKK